MYLTDINLGLYMICGPVKGRFWIVTQFSSVGSEDLPYLRVELCNAGSKITQILHFSFLCLSFRAS